LSLKPETIDAFFDRYEWTYKRDSPDLWDTGWRGDTRNVRMYVKLGEDWIYFTVQPFLAAPRPEFRARLHEVLLRYNRAMNLAKFGVDADGDIVLTVELPCKDLAYEAFCDAMGALTYYADETYVELLNVATQEGAASRYDEQAE
jgi:hypothetical protein